MDFDQLSFPWADDASPGEKHPAPPVITRRQRGYQIFLTNGVRKIPRRKEWKVASQSVQGALYTVRYVLGRFVCNCLDFEDRREPCKHISAVGFLEDPHERETPPEPPGTVIPLKRNWNRYNATKPWVESGVTELLLQLTRVIEDPPRRRGNPPAPIAELLFASIMKVYVRESGRDFCGDVLRRWSDTNHISRLYHFNTLSAFMRRRVVTGILRELIRESAAPLADLGSRAIAVDSTGFTTSTSSTWYDVKYHRTRKRNYLKLHIAVDAETHVITDAIVSKSNGDDTTRLPTLLKGTVIRVAASDVVADKAYAGKPNYDAIQQLGLMPIIPPREGMTGRGNAFMSKMFHAFRAEDPEILRRYHQRSNVESVMFMIKRQFGDQIAARSDAGQINELLAKALCHNLHCLIMATAELGLKARFFRNRGDDAA